MEKTTDNLYNGYKGRPINTGSFTWLVNLHLSNEEATAGDMDAALLDAIETAQEEKKHGFYSGSLTSIAVRILAARIRDYIEFRFEDLGMYSARHEFEGRLAADLLCYALDAVDFNDIAETMIEDYKAAGGTELNEKEEKESEDK